MGIVVAQQRDFTPLVIDDQRPVVDADRHIRQDNIGVGVRRQLLEAAPQIVAEQPQRAAKERQVRMGLRRESTLRQLLRHYC